MDEKLSQFPSQSAFLSPLWPMRQLIQLRVFVGKRHK
jgi:hypothetical protein